MIEWFNSFDGFFQGVIIAAGIATIVMILQIIFLLVGIGLDSSFDGDVPVDSDIDGINDGGFFDFFGLRILTVRNAFVFISLGGWSSVGIFEGSNNYPLAIILGVLIGLVAVFAASYAMKKVEEMQSNGAVDVSNAIGKIATVYLTIPANNSGRGKVNAIVQERLFEFDAMTDDVEAIPTGASVKIVAANEEFVKVEKL